MILLPIGRDQSTIQRHAWISYSIIAANVLTLVATSIMFNTNIPQAAEKIEVALVYFDQHRYLTIPHELSEIVPDDLEHELKTGSSQPPLRWVRELEQAQFDKLASDAVVAFRRLPMMRFGYVPAEKRILALVTSMFVHAGFFHLFGNMLFFFLSGPFVEDVFGRPVFAALYVTGGFAATLTYWAQHPNSTIPLVGASGAIAAVMGAYLVRFTKSKTEFLFIPFWFRPTLHFRFFLPAFVVLPLWFGQQLLEMKSEAGSGTAFSAHVGGFVFGAVFALIVKLTSFEEEHVAPKVQAEVSWQMDPHLERAMTARDTGDFETAKQEIAVAVRAAPTNIDALRMAVEIAKRSDDLAMLDSYRTRLLTRLIQNGERGDAVEIVREVLQEKDVSHTPRLAVRAAAFAEQQGQSDWALTLHEKLFRADPFSASAVASMLKIGILRKARGDASGARDILLEARAHPACSPEITAAIQKLLATTP